VIDGLVESDDLSMYAVLNAVTQAANDADNPEEAQVLMSTGGDLAQHSERCDSCHRIMT
jgi:beta-glucosidase-like glycosyl hydrolase